MNLKEVARLVLLRRPGAKKKHENHYEYDFASAWFHQEDFKRARALKIAGVPDPRCFVLQSCVRALAKVGGDVAECGVRFGKSTRFMLEADSSKRRYHLFDSFEGLAAPTPPDSLPGSQSAHWKAGDIAAAEAIAKGNLSGFKNVSFYRGWIPTRFAEVKDLSFALVHVDVDLYEATRDSVEFFWPRISKGGMLVCDDYGSLKCPGARRALDEFFANKTDSTFVELPSCQALVIKSGPAA